MRVFATLKHACWIKAFKSQGPAARSSGIQEACIDPLSQEEFYYRRGPCLKFALELGGVELRTLGEVYPCLKS